MRECGGEKGRSRGGKRERERKKVLEVTKRIPENTKAIESLRSERELDGWASKIEKFPPRGQFADGRRYSFLSPLTT